MNLGCWLIVKDKIKIEPEVDDELIREFIEFSIRSCPKDYCTEKFENPWFFDSENRLVCSYGKFAEPCVWYRHLKKYFFTPRGYKIPDEDEITILGECDIGFTELEEERMHDYKQWLNRREVLSSSISEYGSLCSFTKRQSGIPPLPASSWPKYWGVESNS